MENLYFSDQLMSTLLTSNNHAPYEIDFLIIHIVIHSSCGKYFD